jgi:hypothetical protein
MTMPDFVVHQEEDVVAARSLVHVAIASVVVAAIGVFFAGLILVLREGSLEPSAAGLRGPQPAPTEISHVEQTPIWETERGEDLEAQQRRDLGTWGWANRDAGIARIPIDRAMDLVVRESQ